eukprot:Tamp_23067.p1 GENE.Tamp_23067~~Tamp_23067.p1  ORF type:complete len:254 (+),score=22.43 Tamp_23067:67-762(+)
MSLVAGMPGQMLGPAPGAPGVAGHAPLSSSMGPGPPHAQHPRVASLQQVGTPVPTAGPSSPRGLALGPQQHMWPQGIGTPGGTTNVSPGVLVPPTIIHFPGRAGVPGLIPSHPPGWSLSGPLQSPAAGGWPSSPHGGVPLSARMEEKPPEMLICVTIPSGISEEVDSLERQARQARQEVKEQRHKSTQDYLSRRAAEFRVALAELEVQMADAQYKAIQGKLLELQHEKLSS